MKNLLFYFTLLSVVIFSGCEKDLYEESFIQNDNQVKGTTRYVSIEDVPFLKPSIEKFKNNIESRAIDSLELDTEHIVEFLNASGFKSYSIIVKKDSTKTEQRYFENLHVIKDANSNVYDSFLVRYKPENEGKIDFGDYTGALEFYNKDKVLTGTLHIENSLLKLLEPAPPTGGDPTGGGGGEDSDCDCGPNVIQQFFNWLNDAFTGIGDAINQFFINLGNLEEGSNSSGPGGFVEIVLTGPGGTMPNPNSGTTSGPGVIFVPNVPVLSNLQQANKIYEWLEVTDLSLRNWLRNHEAATHEIFSNNFDEFNTPTGDKYFALQAIIGLMQGGEVDFPERIIYTINRPCEKQILKDVMAISSPFTNLINSTFGNSESVNVKFWNGPMTHPQTGQPIYAPARTSPTIVGDSENFINIQFNDLYLDNATDLSIAANALHELVHAYFIKLYIRDELVAANQDYQTLLNAFIAVYEQDVPDSFSTLDNEIHNAMKDFIDKMGNALYNYALSKNIDVSSDFCVQLAWSTMYNTDLFLNLTPEEQIDYGNTGAIEQDHMPGYKGNLCP